MKTYELKTQVSLARSPEELFPFFASADNLQIITPPWLRFKITSPLPLEMREGTLIDYTLRIHGIPIGWRTRITAWNPPRHFADEQIKGPYRVWIHNHFFDPIPAGTLARDEVIYAPRGGWLMENLFVRRDLEKIFAYRAQAIQKIFG